MVDAMCFAHNPITPVEFLIQGGTKLVDPLNHRHQ